MQAINDNVVKFLENSKPFSNQLSQLYTYYCSFWLENEKQDKVLINPENFQTASMLRLIKRNVKTSLQMYYPFIPFSRPALNRFFFLILYANLD